MHQLTVIGGYTTQVIGTIPLYWVVKLHIFFSFTPKIGEDEPISAIYRGYKSIYNY